MSLQIRRPALSALTAPDLRPPTEARRGTYISLSATLLLRFAPGGRVDQLTQRAPGDWHTRTLSRRSALAMRLLYDQPLTDFTLTEED